MADDGSRWDVADAAGAAPRSEMTNDEGGRRVTGRDGSAAAMEPVDGARPPAASLPAPSTTNPGGDHLRRSRALAQSLALLSPQVAQERRAA